MAIETLLAELKQLERPISEEARALLLSDLRAHPTCIEKREQLTWWQGRGNIYFHSLQDTLFVNAVFTGQFPEEIKKYVKMCQACFVRDLSDYLAYFPQEETEMRQLFELVLNVGTSAYWEEDKELLLGLHRIYWALDKKVIEPWVRQ